MITCRNCPAVLIPGTLFCPECGVAVSTSPVRPPSSSVGGFPSPGPALMPAVEGGAAGGAWRLTLVIMSTGRQVRFNLSEPICVGRQDPHRGTLPEVDLSGDQGVEFGVSRLHATIQVLENQVVVTDMGSKNGTVLNRQPLLAELPYPLQDGDELRFGGLPVQIFVKSGN